MGVAGTAEVTLKRAFFLQNAHIAAGRRIIRKVCFKHAAENGAPEALLMVTEMDELGIYMMLLMSV